MRPTQPIPASRKEMQLPHLQRGFLLITAVVLIVVAALLLTVMVFMGVTATESGVGHLQSGKALFIAESGTERALYGFSKEGAACASLTYTANIGEGGFSTTGTPYTPAATALSAAISATDTIIPVASVAGYAPFGRVSIGTEQINYGAVSTTSCAPFSAPCLKVAQRGVAGSTAAAYAAGQPVAQNLCLIGSTGTVGSAQRATGVAVQGTLGVIASIGTPAWIGGNAATVTLPYTVAAGSNRVLMVAVSWRRDSAINVANNGVSYGGNTMTVATPASISPTSGGRAVAVQIYRLVNPPVGTANVSVTFSGGSTRSVIGAAAFSGVDQTTPMDAAASTSNGTSNTPQPSVSVTTANSNAWIFDAGAIVGGNAMTIVAAPGRVQTWGPNAQTGGGGPHAEGAASYRGPIATPGATAMNWTITSSDIWALAGVALRPAGAGGAQILYWRENF